MTDLAMATPVTSAVSSRRVLMIGGGTRSLINFRGPLLKQLQQRGHDVVAAAGVDSASDEVRKSLQELEIPLITLAVSRGGTNPWQDLRSERHIRDLLREYRPDVVIAYTAKPVIYGGLAVGTVGGIRFYPMITGLGYGFSEGGGIRRTLVHLAQRQLYRRALRHANTTIFQNPDDQQLFNRLKLVSGGSARVHGSGVDLESFPAVKLPSEPVFLMLARLVAAKGVREYVEAARRVRACFPHARFQLAGALENGSDGITESELSAWEREGVIEYFGRLEGVQSALSSCRCYVLPSYYREGIPRSILEAMATGRPIITTDSPGCRETVEDGVNGYLVTPKSVSSLAGAMTRILVSDSRCVETMAASSLEYAKKYYDVNKVNQDILRITQL